MTIQDSHYHVGFNLPGYPPAGEIATYRTLAEAIDASQANMTEIAAGFPGQDVAIKHDRDPDVVAGTSGWVTVDVVSDIRRDEFSYYFWAGASEGEAGDPCTCEDGESDLAIATDDAS